jgi:site-specific recombinase XerD
MTTLGYPLTSLIKRRLYIAACRSRRLSKRTIEAYNYYLNWFESWAKSVTVTDVRAVDATIIRNFLVSIQTSALGKKRSPNTIHGMSRVLRSFYVFLEKEEVVPVSPMRKVSAPKLPKRIMPALSEDEVRAFIVHWSQWERKPRNERTGLDLFQLRNLALFFFLLDTGLRVEECSRVLMSDVDIKTGRVFVRCGKGENDRVTFASEATLKYVRQYIRLLSSDSKALWIGQYGPIGSDGIQMIFKRVSRELQIQVSPHKIRRTFAIMMLRNGADLYRLKELMGHSDIRTLERYLAIDENELGICVSKNSPVNSIFRTLEGFTLVLTFR